jgi:hypothetical protein
LDAVNRRQERKLPLFLANLRALLFRNFVLLRELSPGLGHFDQQGFVSLIHCLASQAKAFGRAPSVILEFGHETLRLARQRERRSFVPVKNNMGTTKRRFVCQLFSIAENAYRYRLARG